MVHSSRDSCVSDGQLNDALRQRDIASVRFSGSQARQELNTQDAAAETGCMMSRCGLSLQPCLTLPVSGLQWAGGSPQNVV